MPDTASPAPAAPARLPELLQPRRPPRRPPGRPLRERAAAWALAFAALALLGIALLHGTGYVAASIAVSNSGLSATYQETFRSLWLGFALQAAMLAGVLGLAALRPAAVSRAVVGICGLLPIVTVALMQRSSGGTFTGLLLLVATGLVLAGMILQPSRASASRSAGAR